MLNKICTQSLTRFLVKQPARNLSLFGGAKPTSKDLAKYDVVVIGANLAGIFARHFDKATHNHFKTMIVFDSSLNQAVPIRNVYEQGRATKTEYLLSAKSAIDKNTAHSDLVGVDKIVPNENYIVLRNGRKIEYEQLVIGMGLHEDIDGVKNLEDCWKDMDHPVFISKDHPSWRVFQHKYSRWHFNYHHGDAYFCIPQYPFRGEVGGYNFFVSNDIWKWYSSNGRLSPKHKFRIINANDRFVQHLDSADNFIKSKLEKLGIEVEYGWELSELNKEKQIAIFENVKTGEKTQKEYSQLYAMPRCKPHKSLVESGLATKESNFLLDVDALTLRHNKYKNVWGIGDCANLPTTKTFWAGFHQVHTLQLNLEKELNHQPLVTFYNGYTKSSLLLGQNKMTYVVHFYDQREAWTNLLDSAGTSLAYLRYYYWGRSQKKEFLGYYLHQTWGPPFGKAFANNYFFKSRGSPDSQPRPTPVHYYMGKRILLAAGVPEARLA